jgi:hypothetical protein
MTRQPSALALLLVLFLLPLLASSVRAEDGPALAASLGWFDVAAEDVAPEGGLELRLRRVRWELVPTIGLMANADGGVMAHVGVRRDFVLGGSYRWFATPHFAVGFYRSGASKELGEAIEFRSGLEIACALSSESRLGVTFYHLSNAGLARRNPGAESLLLSYSLRLR